MTARILYAANGRLFLLQFEGLIDIPPNAGRRNLDQVGDGTLGRGSEELELAGVLQDSGPEVTKESIDEYKQIQNTGCPQYCKDGCPVIAPLSCLIPLDFDGLLENMEIEDELEVDFGPFQLSKWMKWYKKRQRKDFVRSDMDVAMWMIMEGAPNLQLEPKKPAISVASSGRQ
jgi:hypothetical protein